MKNNLRRIRESMSMSQQEVADKMGISRNSYRKLEAGETKIVNRNVLLFAAELGGSIEECFFDIRPQERMENELREMEDNNEKLRSTVEFYEKQIEELKAAIANREEIIKTLNDINARLASKIGKK